jgi:glycosyltransferase involved in cell wall biosynthesis
VAYEQHVLVSVVVATHNRVECVRRLLDSLAAQTIPAGAFEVIVVDDGSSDGTDQMLAEAARAPLGLRTIRRTVSAGPAAARNDGWRAARAALIAFTDDDCEAAPEWLAEGLRSCQAHPGAVVQGRVDPMPAEAHHESPFTRTLRVHGDGPYYQTCNIFYPRALLERLGGFDAQTYPVPGGEDTDLAWRAIEAGAPTAYADRAQVFHAVARIGARGRLRVASRWSRTLQVYRRHPGARERVFTRGVFWKPWHYTFVRATLALFLPRRLRYLRVWLIGPYVNSLQVRCEYEHGHAWHAPFYVVEDLVEIGAALRASVRYRMLVI